MAIIYTYPTKATPADADLILISDSESNPANQTKQITVASIKGLTSGVTSIIAGTNVTISSTGASGTGDVTINSSGGSGPSTAMTTSTLGLGKLRYATGSTPAAETQSTTANRTYGVTANSSDQLVVNVPWTDTSGISFSGSTANGVATYSSATTANVSANLTFATNTLTLTDTLDIKGDGVNPGTLNLYCENTSTPHAVSILGPQHSGATPYSIRLPKEIATQTAYSSGGRVLESDASGALQWINTPTAGGISFSGSTADGIATYSSATQANVSSTFTVSGDKLSAPAGSVADPSIEVGAVGGLYAASGGVFLAHGGANAIGLASSSIVNYKLTQFNSGLKFGSSGDTLESYEEGSWTPVMYGAGSPSVTVAGQYVKIGRNVTVWFSLICTAGDQLANARISGLPFNGQGASVYGHNGGASLSVNTGNSASTVYVTGTSGGASTLDLKVFTSTTDYQYALGYWPNSQGNFTVRGTYTYKSQS
jgi:hypothetical protein